jgi:hypothetical protein
MGEKSEGESPPQQSEMTTDAAALIWDEYKYRHEHCWKTIFKLTSAAVILGVIPYLDTKLPKEFWYWLLAPPVLAVALIGFGMLRMVKELSLLRDVKSLHRERQRRLYRFHNDGRPATFDKHVWWYLGILLFLATVNVIVAAVRLFG